jgi:hypothetical protein
VLTGRRSVSLGKTDYAQLLAAAGMQLIGTCMDEGDNHYIEAVRWSDCTEVPPTVLF